MVDPSGVMVMCSSEGKEEDTDDEEEKIDPSDMPELSDTDNTDDSDNEGANDSHDSGRSSPDQPDGYGECDDSETEPDQEDKRGYNDEHKNVLPGLVTPGDSGIEDHSDSEFNDELDEENPGEGNKRFKGTEFYNEYFDKTRNTHTHTHTSEHQKWQICVSQFQKRLKESQKQGLRD